MSTLGSRIKAARIGAGITQQRIADAFEITRGAVSQWEADIVAPETAKLKRLASMLDVSLDHLIGGKSPRQRNPIYQEETNAMFYALESLPELLGQRQFDMLCQALDLTDAMREAKLLNAEAFSPGAFIATAIQHRAEQVRMDRHRRSEVPLVGMFS